MYQLKQAERSPRNTAAGPDAWGLCDGFSQWCNLAPQIGPADYLFLPDAAGNLKLRFAALYDFPNGYCQFWCDNCPPECTAGTWPIPFTNTLVRLRNGATTIEGPFPAVFENALWMPWIDAGACDGRTQTYYLDAINQCNSTVSAPVAVTFPTSTSPLCEKHDRRDSCSLNGRSSGVGKPINVGSGNVSAAIPLFEVGQEPLSLRLSLTYHSERSMYPSFVTSPISSGWTHSFNETLRALDSRAAYLYHMTAEGYETIYEPRQAGGWKAMSPSDLRTTVTLSGSEYRLFDENGTITRFDTSTGRWLSTTDRWGNAISGTYNSGILTTITDSMGRQVTLTYSGSQLAQIQVDGKSWILQYGGGNLSSIFDPLHAPGGAAWRSFTYQTDSQGATRLLTTVYDDAGKILEGHTYDTADRGTSSFAQGNRDLVTVAYDSPSAGQRHVVHTIDGVLVETTDFTVTYQSGRWLPTLVNGTCASCGGGTESETIVYDANNRVTSRTDAAGHVTGFVYDASGNVRFRTEAQGTAVEWTTTYAYEYPSWPAFVTRTQESSIAKPGSPRATTRAWSGGETVLTEQRSGYIASSDSFATTYTRTTTFGSRHRAIQRTGPSTNEKTTWAYYADADADVRRRGRLQTETTYTTSSATLATNFSTYDIYGTAKSVVDPNAVETRRTTDDRGRILTETSVKPAADSNEPADYVTTWQYDGRDRLVSMTQPRGFPIKYLYEDGTNRIVDIIRTGAGANERERIHRTLNAIGATTEELTQTCSTPANPCTTWSTQRRENFVYDAHNRLAEIDYPVPAGAKTIYVYDVDGLLASIQDERHVSPNTINEYDARHRLKKVRQALAGAPGGEIATIYDYFGDGSLKSVTDPNGNITTYAYDDFGGMRKQTSPVTGVTTYAYDASGNLASSTDANVATTARTYDAANRVTAATSTRSNAATETVTWTYDDATAFKYGKGRLAQVQDPSGTTAYAYERRGLPRSVQTTINSTSYSTAFAYDANGNRTRITYPSGVIVNFGYDFADRPGSASHPAGNGVGATTFVSSASYQPFGPVSSISNGNGTTITRTYNLRYQPTNNKLMQGGTRLAEYSYGLDAAGNIASITDAANAAYNRTFGYDDLSRLTTANGGASLWGGGTYAYDRMGNPTSLTLGSARSATLTYQGTTPKLASVAEGGTTRFVRYDAAGNEHVSSTPVRLSARNFVAASGTLAYRYNGQGVRTLVSSATPPFTLTQSFPSVVGGSSVLGTVNFASGLPPEGAVVALDSSDPSLAAVPASVTVIPGGGAGGGGSGGYASFNVTTTAVASTRTVAITAGWGGETRSMLYEVTPGIRIASLTPEASGVTGGRTTRVIVTLNATTPGDAVVSLSITGPVVSPPSTMTVPAGSFGNSVQLTTSTVTTPTTVTVNATYQGASIQTSFTVLPSPSVESVVFSQTSVIGGQAIGGSVTLTSLAAVAGAIVTLTSSNPSVAAVSPASLTISGDGGGPAGGGDSGQFTVTTTTVGVRTNVTITATYPAGVSQTAVLTVTPAIALDSVTAPASVASGATPQGMVTLNAYVSYVDPPAVISLTSSNPPAASVPSSVSVSGGNVAWFAITPGSVATPVQVTITASWQGLTKTATMVVTPAGFAAGARRSFLYTPELRLMSETEYTDRLTPAPLVQYEYVWFGGEPLAQIEPLTGAVHWIFNDHLGTPLVVTNTDATTFWRAEYEPYGRVFALRSTDQHQPLRLPGQEAEQLNLGANGASETSYNVFRWYRAGWGRYTQADPIGLEGGVNIYAYSDGNPVRFADPRGLCAKDPRLANCNEPGSGCCTAKAIDDLRYGICLDKQMQPGLTAAATGFFAIGTTATGLALGGGKGALIGAACGIAIGSQMGNTWMLGFENLIKKGGLRHDFTKKMGECGYDCGNKSSTSPCFVKQLFEEIYAEELK
jgi:RHS repeat-associated protein